MEIRNYTYSARNNYRLDLYWPDCTVKNIFTYEDFSEKDVGWMEHFIFFLWVH